MLDAEVRDLQVLRNTARTLQATFYVDETPTDATGAVTVTITRADGTALATAAATTADGEGVYSYTLAAQANLDILTVAWTGTWGGVASTPAVHTVEIVGGHYLSIRDLRTTNNLGDTAKFPTEKLEQARMWFEHRVEDYVGIAFVPRYRRDTLDGSGTRTLTLSRWPLRRLLSVTVDGVTQTTTTWAKPTTAVLDQVTGTFTLGAQNVVVAYEYGLDAPPQQLRDAAKTAIRDHLLGNYSGPRAFLEQGEFGIVRLSQPGPDRPFGIPEVDAVLNDLNETLPAMA